MKEFDKLLKDEIFIKTIREALLTEAKMYPAIPTETNSFRQKLITTLTKNISLFMEEEKAISFEEVVEKMVFLADLIIEKEKETRKYEKNKS